MLTEEQVAELETKYPGVVRLHGTDPLDESYEWEVFLRRPKPDRSETKMFLANIHNDTRKAEEGERLFKVLCVYPDAAGLTSLLSRLQALAYAPVVVETIGKMIGLADATRGK